MKEALVNGQGAILARDESAKVAQPRDAAFDDPALLVTPQHAPILRCRPVTVRAVRSNQGDCAPPQPFAPRVAVVALVGNHPRGLLSRSSTTAGPPDADRRLRFFRQPDFRRGSRVKSVSPRNTAAAASRSPARETARANPATEPRGAASTKSLPALCAHSPQADPRAVAAVAGETRAGSFPMGRRPATDRIASSALLLALLPLATHLHRKITIPNSTRGPGF